MRLRRQLKDEEVCLLVELLGELSELRGVGVGEDVLRWIGSKNGKFSVSSFYHLLCGRRATVGPWRAIWFSALPPKVSFFV